MSQVCVYHIKQPGFRGEKLYPLSKLKGVHPDIHARYLKKYEGREWMNAVVIEYFNCLWNDVLHFSLMHPSLIYKTLTDLGFEHHKVQREWFEVPLHAIPAASACLFRNEDDDDDDGRVRSLPVKDFEPVDAARVVQLSVMPERNLRYYKRCSEKKTPPLLWGYAPHLLYKGELEVKELKVLDWSAAA